ncbi:MAG: ATP-dependent DNA helicase [Patescibacteria group bacterium]
MDLRSLNKEQVSAVKHGKGPLLIIAGAGTGKTTVITKRIEYLLLEKNIKPQEILALTFTEKAAFEMQERIDKALPYGYSTLWISTFHSFCDSLLHNESFHIGLNPSYHLMTEAESVLYLRKNIFKLPLDYFRPLGNPDKFLEGLLNHFSRLRDEDISEDEYLSFTKRLKPKNDLPKEEILELKELSSCFKSYQALKIKEGVMDFADLITFSLKLFRKRPNVLKNYTDQFKYILVDEFQDTNFSQNELAIMLSGEDKNITVVGDDDQAIYRWRGAAISNIIQFRKKFPSAKVITLNKNYRSTQEILDRSYRLIQFNNPDRLEVKEKIDKKLITQRKVKGFNVEFIFTERVEDEAENVASKIKDLSEKRGVSLKEIAILVRANDHSGPFIRALERNRIPYQFLGPGQLFHQAEIKDLIAYLRVLVNFEDSESFYRVLNMKVFRIDPRDIAAVLNFARRLNLSLFEALEKIDEVMIKDESKQKFKDITDMVKRHFKLLAKDSGGQIIYYFIKDSGLINELLNAKTAEEELRSLNTAKFFDKIKTFEAGSENPSAFALLDWINLSMEMGESPLAANIDWGENDAVNILTIHSSKGLEFRAVFLTNLVENRFPTRDRKEQIPIPKPLIKEILPVGDYHLEEERRLFYVGMTRSKDFLFLTASKYYGEGKRERKISPFVYESLGAAEVERITEEKMKTKGQISFLDFGDTLEKPSIQTKPSADYLPSYISYSQIQTFEQCPLHYKLKYILRIPVPPTSAQSYGTSIHSALRDFYKLTSIGEKPQLPDLLKALDSNWIREGYASKKHLENAYEKAKKLLTTYFKKYYSDKTKTLGIEYPFKFRLEDLSIGGRIDRIDDLGEGRIEIIDYKTGLNIPDKRSLEKNIQLTFYALAATEIKDEILGRTPEKIILSLFYLEKGEKFSTVRTGQQLEEAKDYIAKKVSEISKSDFQCSIINCGKCEYQMLCQGR